MLLPEQVAGPARIDYRDQTTVAIGGSRPHAPLDWSRRILEDAPVMTRRFLRFAWRAGLLITLAPEHKPGHVFGWRIVDTPDVPGSSGVVLSTHSRIGLHTRLVIDTDGDRLVLRTLIQHEHLGAKLVWALVAPIHRPIVRHLLRTAARRAGA